MQTFRLLFENIDFFVMLILFAEYPCDICTYWQLYISFSLAVEKCLKFPLNGCKVDDMMKICKHCRHAL